MAADVVVVRWPEDRAEVRRLAAANVPRLLLVAADADAPPDGGCEQDWIRLPALDRDVAARLEALAGRAARHASAPELDDHGRLHFHGRWVAPSPVEHRLVSALVERFGDVVAAEELLGRAWPDEVPQSNALRVHLARLRRRIAPIGLCVRVVRPAGYVLEAAA